MVIGKQTKHYHKGNFLYDKKIITELKLIEVKEIYLTDTLLCPDYPVVHLQHLMITDPTDWSGIRPDYPVLRDDTYTDWSRLDGRVGVCVMAFILYATVSTQPSCLPQDMVTVVWYQQSQPCFLKLRYP